MNDKVVNHGVRRQLKEWGLALIVPVLILLSLISWAQRSSQASRIEEHQAQREREALLVTNCAIESSNIFIANRLNRISRDLGLPTDPVPEVSTVCEDLQSSPSP